MAQTGLLLGPLARVIIIIQIVIVVVVVGVLGVLGGLLHETLPWLVSGCKASGSDTEEWHNNAKKNSTTICVGGVAFETWTCKFGAKLTYATAVQRRCRVSWDRMPTLLYYVAQ